MYKNCLNSTEFIKCKKYLKLISPTNLSKFNPSTSNLQEILI